MHKPIRPGSERFGIFKKKERKLLVLCLKMAKVILDQRLAVRITGESQNVKICIDKDAKNHMDEETWLIDYMRKEEVYIKERGG